MRLMTILLEALLEARVKEISKFFFDTISQKINKDIKPKLQELDKLIKEINLEKDKYIALEKKQEFKKKKNEIKEKVSELLVSYILEFFSFDLPDNMKYEVIKPETSKELAGSVIFQSEDYSLKGVIDIDVYKAEGRGPSAGHKIKIDPYNHTKVLLKGYPPLWEPSGTNIYRPGVGGTGDIEKGSQFGKYATGAQKSKVKKQEFGDERPSRFLKKGVKSYMNVGSRTLSRNKGLENTRKAIESEFAWDEVLNKFAKEEKGVAPGNRGVINNKIEDLILNIINVCLEKEMINLDQSELDTEVKLVGDPSGDNQEVIAYLGPEGTPIIKVSTFINNKTYKVDKYKTKIQVNGLDMT